MEEPGRTGHCQVLRSDDWAVFHGCTPGVRCHLPDMKPAVLTMTPARYERTGQKGRAIWSSRSQLCSAKPHKFSDRYHSSW